MPKLEPRKTTSPSGTNASDFATVSEYLGFRNREDKTNLPPGYLVVGSQNVLTTTSGRVSIRKGYELDGQASSALAPILSSFDWIRYLGDERNVRAGFLTSAGNDGKLQFRYVAEGGEKIGAVTLTAGEVYWVDLLSSLTSVKFNFTDYWDNSAFISKLLFVNGGSNIWEWSGGVTTFASATVNTITKNGTETWGELGFTSTGSVVINGNTYTYAGGFGTTTLTGVAPDPSGEPVDSLIFQSAVSTANSAMTSIPATLKNDNIATLRNQVYVGSFTARQVYVSKVNDYQDFSFTSPTRVVGEGALLTLDANFVAFSPQETSMYLSTSNNSSDIWYQTQFTLSSDLTKEDFQIVRVKTGPRQGAKSQAFITKTKNDVLYVSNEPSMDSLGRVVNIQATPQSEDISDSIRDSFDNYDFEDGSSIYFQNFVYVAIPKNNTVLIWNMVKQWWEAPQILPISRFSIIEGQLYGHSYQTSQTFKLFTGYNDNGNPIDARAVFSYNNYGTRSAKKFFNEFYAEGYISSNSTLTANITYDIDGCATVTNYDILGNDTQIVCSLNSSASLGKSPLGKNPLGGDLSTVSATALPPKFRVIKTFPRNDFYEVQFSFSSLGVDQQWELLAFGPLVTRSPANNTNIKQ